MHIDTLKINFPSKINRNIEQNLDYTYRYYSVL